MHQVPLATPRSIVISLTKQQVIAAALQSLSFDPNYLGDDDEGDEAFDDDDGNDDDDTFWKVRLVSSRLLASCARTGLVTGDILLQTVLPPLLLRLQDRIDIVISESLSTFKECLHKMGPARQQLTPADAQRFIKCLSKESRSKDSRLQENLFSAGDDPKSYFEYNRANVTIFHSPRPRAPFTRPHVPSRLLPH